MNRTRIKICGVRDERTALACAQAGADAVGLVFVKESPRYVKPHEASLIVKSLPPFVATVGLFVDEQTDHIRMLAEELALDAVQLHGDETQQAAEDLSPIRILKAVHFTDVQTGVEAFNNWHERPSNLSAVLVDAPPQSHLPSARGGSGRVIDHAMLNDTLKACEAGGDVSVRSRLILAGGLNPDNVVDAVRTIRPYAVDVSSGVESSRGVKDARLIRLFCEAVRRADQE
ncbi:MAG: N-(5'-phosphoribosyl)anthranilate isomerase [Phycisphaera sp.]|nr:N-(5'-phosphoribosyl)anthranilate isomerase [Phycisphaera sp.]